MPNFGYKPPARQSSTSYNPRAYVPGGSTPAVAKAIQAKGYAPTASYKPSPPPPPKAPTQQPAPAPKPQAAGAAPTAAPAESFNIDVDPVLARIMGISGRDRETARAEADAAKKQLAIDYGDEGFARSMGLDEGTVQAAKGNPFSQLAKLLHQFDTTKGRLSGDLAESFSDLEHGYGTFKRDIAQDEQKQTDSLNQAMNEANLWYSGQRTMQELPELARSFQQTRDDAAYDYEDSRSDRQTDYDRSLEDATRGYQEGTYGAGVNAQGLFGQIQSALTRALMEADRADAQAQSDAARRAIEDALMNPQAPAAQATAPGPPQSQNYPAATPSANQAAQQALEASQAAGNPAWYSAGEARGAALNQMYGLGAYAAPAAPPPPPPDPIVQALVDIIYPPSRPATNPVPGQQRYV